MATMDWRPDRRRSARVDLLAELEGHLVTLDEAIAVRQVGSGGLTIAMTAPLSPHVAHDLRLSFEGRTAIVRAVVRHSRVQVAGDQVTYVSGLEFVDVSEDARGVLDAILDRAGAAVDPGDTM